MSGYENSSNMNSSKLNAAFEPLKLSQLW